MLERAELLKSMSGLKDHYSALFERTFSSKPFLDPDWTNDWIWLIDNFGFEKAKDILSAYFVVKDDWISSQGFTIPVLRKNINKVLASTGTGKSKRLYTVAFTVSGVPVQGHHQFCCEWISEGIKNPLYPGVEIMPENYDKPVEPWKINGKWYGGLYGLGEKEIGSY